MSLCGCSAENSQIDKNTDTEQVTIRIASSWGGNDATSGVFHRVLQQFQNKNEDVKIINDSIVGEEYISKLKADFASSNQPDIFSLAPGDIINTLIENDKIADLTAVLDNNIQWKSDFSKGSWDAVTVDGQIYGVPFERAYLATFVNEDIFKSLNLQVPSTFNELCEVIPRLREANIVPLIYTSGEKGNLLYQQIVAMLAGNINIGSMSKNDPEYKFCIDAVGYMKKLYELGAFPDDFFSLSDAEGAEFFINKKAAFIVRDNGFISDITKSYNSVTATKESETSDVLITNFPYIEESLSHHTAVVNGYGNGTFFISKKAFENDKTRDVCIEILKELTSKANATIFAEQLQMLTCLKIDPPGSYYSDLMIEGSRFCEKAYEYIPFPYAHVDREVWDNLIVKNIPYYLIGQLDAKTVISDGIRDLSIKKSMQE